MVEKGKKDNSIWGLVLAWYDEYTRGRSDFDFEAKILFLREYGMKTFCTSLNEVDRLAPEEKERLFELLEKHDMYLCPHFNTDHMALGRDEMERKNEKILTLLDKYLRPLRAKVVAATCGKSHRYDRAMPFSEKVDRFSYLLSPIAKLCKDKGAPLALENHADYFCSEIVQIIKATPGMYLLFDTANALHIGEQPVKAALDAAPYTIGTHFKDHFMVKGENPPLHYEIRGCALGDGDAELEECYRIIKENSPFRDNLIMFIELFKPDNMSAMECWTKSLNFIRYLREKYD